MTNSFMGNYKIGFLFDLDGVIIDSESEYTRIWEDIDAVYPTGIKNFAIKIKGCTLPEILNIYFPKTYHKAVVKMLNEREQKMRYNYLPGARELLTEIKSMGYGSILVTSSNDLKMKHLRKERPELENYFEDIVTADRISKSKPDPEGYLLGSSLLNVNPKKCVVFEDSRQGVMAGRSSGAYVIGLTTTLPETEIREYCDIIVKNLSDINMNKLTEILLQR